MTPNEQAQAAYITWRGRTSPLQPWFLTVAVKLIGEGATASKDAKPDDRTFRDACDLVNAEYGSPAYTMPGAKTTIPIQFIAALLMSKPAAPGTGTKVDVSKVLAALDKAQAAIDAARKEVEAMRS